jgi:hypothetical protein
MKLRAKTVLPREKLSRRHFVNTNPILSASASIAYPLYIHSENMKTSKTYRAWNSNFRYRNRFRQVRVNFIYVQFKVQLDVFFYVFFILVFS